MSAIEEIEEKLKSPERLETLRRAIYQLRRRQFIWAGDRHASGAYDALINYGCLDILQDHFELEGLALQHNTAEQWVGLSPLAEFVDIMADERLVGDETLVLLILALTWREGVNNAVIGQRGVVETTADALMERLSDLTQRDRLKNPQIRDARFHEILRDFARRSLIHIGEEDPLYLDYAIQIRPMITQLVGNDLVARLETFAIRGLPSEAEIAQAKSRAKKARINCGDADAHPEADEDSSEDDSGPDEFVAGDPDGEIDSSDSTDRLKEDRSEELEP
jgi:hypothetical protein